MNKLWVFIGGCVTGSLGLLAASAMFDEKPSVSTNTDDEANDTLPENGQEEDCHFATDRDETAQAKSSYGENLA